MEPFASPKLLDRFRQAIRLKHYSYRTEQIYPHLLAHQLHYSGEPKVIET